ERDELGLHGWRGARVPAARAMALRDPRRGDPRHGARRQPRRRRAERRAQPAAALRMTDAILEVRDLTVALPPGADRPHAVEGVSFSLDRNEILCLVGESGSGKSIAARSIMGLL